MLLDTQGTSKGCPVRFDYIEGRSMEKEGFNPVLLVLSGEKVLVLLTGSNPLAPGGISMPLEGRGLEPAPYLIRG